MLYIIGLRENAAIVLKMSMMIEKKRKIATQIVIYTIGENRTLNI